MKLKLTKPRIITSGIVIITLIAAMITLPNLVKQGDDVYAYTYRDGYAITPESSDSTGVVVDSSYLLTTNLDGIKLLVEEVGAHLTLSPEVDFTLSQVDEGVRITLDKSLEHQSIYTWSYKGISFAFQTQSDFMLLGTLPSAETTNVPVTTGIEFYMSHAGAQVEDVFSIEPAVRGKFEEQGNVVVFVPTGGLQEKTIYTVTLRSGMTLKDSDKTIDESYTFSFETGLEDETSFQEPKGYLSFNNILNDYSTTEIPSIPINMNTYQEDTQQVIQTTLYQFKDVTEVTEALLQYESLPVWSSFGYETFSVETEKLDQVASFELPLPSSDMYPQVFSLPENLPAGYYLVDARWEDLHVQTFIQVTDLSYTMIEDETNYHFWVHDLNTGKEAQQVNILGPTGEVGITDATGLGQIKKNSNDDNILSVIQLQGQGKEAIALSMNWNQRYLQDSNTHYWRYLQTDRGLYQPKDTVAFFGFLKSRYATSADVKEVTVEITQGNFYFYSFMPFFREQDALVREKIQLNQGFFEGQIELPSLEAGYYQIQVKHGDSVLATQSIQVEPYVKPDYKIEISKDKEALFVDETIVFNVNTAFFEGTPVANLDVNYQVGATNQEANPITSDDQGQFQVQYTPTYSSDYQGEAYGYFSAFATLPESGEIYGNSSFRVFVNDMHVKVESQLEQETGKINIETHRITLDRLNDGTAENSEDYLAQALPGVVLDGEIMRNEWIKTEVGEVYDFINKETRKEYRYDLKTTMLKSFSVTTNQLGQVEYEVNLPKETSVYYHVVLKTKDQQNRPMKFESYFGSHEWMYPSDGSYLELKMDKENYQDR
jgi:alpha-2-macroglobulin